jgi:hypothetical protein
VLLFQTYNIILYVHAFLFCWHFSYRACAFCKACSDWLQLPLAALHINRHRVTLKIRLMMPRVKMSRADRNPWLAKMRITIETVACLRSKFHLKQNLIPSWPWSFQHTSCISDFRCKTKYTNKKFCRTPGPACLTVLLVLVIFCPLCPTNFKKSVIICVVPFCLCTTEKY